MALTDMAYEVLKTDLSAPRMLLPQVINYITDHYGYPTNEIERFFREKYPTLEDYEVDLTFSPQFTPAEHNRLEYIPILGGGALAPHDVALLKKQLEEAGLTTVLKTPDGMLNQLLPVHEVFIDRYVNLLKLDQKLPARIYQEITSTVPDTSRNEVNLLGREEVWQSEERQDILIGVLRVFKAQNNFSTMKISFLTNFLRTYRPTHLQDLGRQLESLIKSCETDMENVSGRGFHDEYLRALHGSDRLNHHEEKDVWDHYRHMMGMAKALKEDLEHLPEAAPDIFERLNRQPV